MKKRSRAWAEYEEIVAAIYEEFSESFEVQRNVRILGKSGSFRQIDVVLRKSIAGNDLLLIIDAKHYKHRVNQNRVDQLIGLIEDVDAARGILVSDSGYTAGAINRANADKRLQLVSVIDTKNRRLRSQVYIPVHFTEYSKGKSINVSFKLDYLGANPCKDSASDAKQQAECSAKVLREICIAFMPTLIERYCDYFNARVTELPAGTNAFITEVFRDESRVIIGKVEFDTIQEAYVTDDVLEGRAIYDHITRKVVASSKEDVRGIRLNLHDVRSKWQPVTKDFKAKAGTIWYRSIVAYKEGYGKKLGLKLAEQIRTTELKRSSTFNAAFDIADAP